MPWNWASMRETSSEEQKDGEAAAGGILLELTKASEQASENSLRWQGRKFMVGQFGSLVLSRTHTGPSQPLALPS